MTVRVLVTGGRDYVDASTVQRTLDELDQQLGIVAVIEGGALGADAGTRWWAWSRGMMPETYKAAWRYLGPSAGPRRNTTMLENSRPDLVIAFPGGVGTKDCVTKAIARGIKVLYAGRRT